LIAFSNSKWRSPTTNPTNQNSAGDEGAKGDAGIMEISGTDPQEVE